MFDDTNNNEQQAEQVNWQGWTPPWMEGQGPQDWQGPRGPFGPGRGFGGHHGHGHHEHHGHGPFGPGRGFGGPRGYFNGPRGMWGGWGWQGPRGPFGPGFGPGPQWRIPEELLALRAEAMEVARLFAIASRGAFENKERVAQLRSFLDRSRKELSDMIYGSAQASQGQQSQQEQTPNTGEQNNPGVEQV